MKKLLLSFVAIFSLAVCFSSCGTDYSQKDSLKDVKGEELNKVLDQLDELVADFETVTKDAIEYAKQKGEAPDNDSKIVKKGEELISKINKLEKMIESDDVELSDAQNNRFKEIIKKLNDAYYKR